MQLVRNKVFVVPEEVQQTNDKGIYKSQKFNQKPTAGVVAMVGIGTPVDVMEVTVGQTVYYTPGVGEMIEIAGKCYLAFNEDQLLGYD